MSPRNSLVRWTGGHPDASESSMRSGHPPEADDAGFLSLTPERARILLLVAARPAAFALSAITVLVLVTLLAAGSGLAGAAGAVAASWLAVHQVPLVIGKTTLGLLPLLPTALLLGAAGRECYRAVAPNSSRTELGWVVGAALGGPLLLTAVCLAVAEDASAVVALQPPDTLAAFGWVAFLHLGAAGAGIALRMRRRMFDLARAPEWVIAGIYGAGRTVLRLLGCAAAVTLVSFLAHWDDIGDTYRSAGNAWGFIGLTLLSLAYLPNVVLGTLGVLMGASANFGAASIGLFGVVGGPVPAVPVMAAVPTGPAAAWWSALLVVPAAVGVLGGVDAGRTSGDRLTAPWATLTSAGAATLSLVLLGALAGGELGTFGRVGLALPIFAVVSFVWLAAAGYVGLVCARYFIAPVGAVLPGQDYYDDDDADYYDADADYYDDDESDGYHRRADDDYREDDYYDDEYYDDDQYYDDDPYDDDQDDALEAELVDEPPTLATPQRQAAPDIVDAEVVETDPDFDSRADGRR
ncbi:cell division protein PerM [Nocardia lijiangensis]|uniref:cell division protein PerM n=1 Tax=Nocardia lijiangensis TaxID=299618 RepID=UPI003D73E742